MRLFLPKFSIDVHFLVTFESKYEQCSSCHILYLEHIRFSILQIHVIIDTIWILCGKDDTFSLREISVCTHIISMIYTNSSKLSKSLINTKVFNTFILTHFQIFRSCFQNNQSKNRHYYLMKIYSKYILKHIMGNFHAIMRT